MHIHTSMCTDTCIHHLLLKRRNGCREGWRTYTYTYAHTCIHTHIMYTHAHTCIHTHIHLYTRTYMYTHAHTCTHTHAHIDTCIHHLLLKRRNGCREGWRKPTKTIAHYCTVAVYTRNRETRTRHSRCGHGLTHCRCGEFGHHVWLWHAAICSWSYCYSACRYWRSIWDSWEAREWRWCGQRCACLRCWLLSVLGQWYEPHGEVEAGLVSLSMNNHGVRRKFVFVCFVCVWIGFGPVIWAAWRDVCLHVLWWTACTRDGWWHWLTADKNILLSMSLFVNASTFWAIDMWAAWRGDEGAW